MMESNAAEFLAALSLSGVKWGSLRADNDAMLLTNEVLFVERSVLRKKSVNASTLPGRAPCSLATLHLDRSITFDQRR